MPAGKRITLPGKNHLQSQADSEEWPAVAENVFQEREQSLPRKVLHAIAECANAGQDDPPAQRQLLWAPADQRGESEGFQRLADATEVPHAVVDDADDIRPAHPRTPFVEGTPLTRDSIIGTLANA